MSIRSLSSSSSSSDDEQEMHQQIRNNPPKLNAFEHYSDVEFKERFRVTKETVLHIVELIGPQITPPTNRNNALSATDQVCVTLRFYATGSYQRVIGDIFLMHQTTVHRVVHRVTAAIASLSRQYIRMPETTRQMDIVVNKFYSIAGFPRVLGALDCTHIRTMSPGGPNAEVFRCRKHFFSLNVEVVGDADLLVRNVVARWPGSVHDSTIFNNSSLSARFENGEFGNYLLIGDSGYPCRPYLLTPVANPTTPGEEAYNRAHVTTRNTIERLFGVLKRRFPCLHVGLGIKIHRVPAVVVACCVLHNIAIMRNDNFNSNENFAEDHDDEIDSTPRFNQNSSRREEIIQHYFT